MKIVDFYKGFEGSGEIIIFEKDNLNRISSELHIWEGYWESFLTLIPYDIDYHKDSVMYNFLWVEGWKVDAVWECKRIVEFYNQLQAILGHIQKDDIDPYMALLDILFSAIENNNRIFVSYR